MLGFEGPYQVFFLWNEKLSCALEYSLSSGSRNGPIICLFYVWGKRVTGQETDTSLMKNFMGFFDVSKFFGGASPTEYQGKLGVFLEQVLPEATI